MSDNPVELAEEAAVCKLIADALYARSKSLSSRAGQIMGRGTLYPRLPDGSEMASFVMPSPSTVVSVDVDTLLPFVRANYPTEVVETVRPSFVDRLKQTSKHAGQPCAPDGTLDVPGITVTQEPAKGPRITPTDTAKAQAQAAVNDVLNAAIERFERPQLSAAPDQRAA